MDPLTAQAIEAAIKELVADIAPYFGTYRACGAMSAIKELVADIAPHARYVPKYGGHVIALDPDSDTTFVGGFFTSANHVSLEFSEGASFDDPNCLLEGKGKKRRHLKFTDVGEVTAKDARAFLTQALG